MTKQTSSIGVTPVLRNQGEGNVVTEEHRFRYVDQEERWRQEYKHRQTVENSLAVLSKLHYEPVDYAAMMVRTPWKERPLTDFSFLLTEAREQVEKEYFFQVAKRIAFLIVLIVALVIGANAAVLWITGVLGVAVAVSLYFVMQDKRAALEKAMKEAQEEMEKRGAAERSANEKAKAAHEQREEERVAEIEQLLDGDLSAVILKIDAVVSKIPLPFLLDVDIEIYQNIPRVRVWLPNRSIIPHTICEMLPSGRLKYTEKELLEINRQYLELCASLLVKVMSEIYAHVPSFDKGYICGISKEDLQNHCIMGGSLEREELAAACEAGSGLAAVQVLHMTFESDTNLKLLPIEQADPPEWEEVDRKDIRCINIKISQ